MHGGQMRLELTEPALINKYFPSEKPKPVEKPKPDLVLMALTEQTKLLQQVLDKPQPEKKRVDLTATVHRDSEGKMKTIRITETEW